MEHDGFVEETRKTYDLEERTFLFAENVRELIRNLKMTVANLEDSKQLIRASGSVGANYIEANDSLGNKDFLMHMRISRKEAKESRFWLRLLYVGDDNALKEKKDRLITEAYELMNIFGSILKKYNT